MGRDKKYASELTPEYRANATKLLLKVNQLLKSFGSDRTVNSGWRPLTVNQQAGGSKNSHHIKCNAIDLEDGDGKLAEWCAQHLDVMELCGLYMEHKSATPTWCHLQQIAPKSGNRIFRP
jgi:uncharacterized protein YcbK (DUF882 family)